MGVDVAVDEDVDTDATLCCDRQTCQACLMLLFQLQKLVRTLARLALYSGQTDLVAESSVTHVHVCQRRATHNA